jgi:hypothetical protein
MHPELAVSEAQVLGSERREQLMATLGRWAARARLENARSLENTA